ncbi:hypothetical protein D7B24_004783 [Verticillium nonalfalfae]|uniref:Uncharacterized protein n=1 Tax=Verticillium nonalfalfae TaxID=1051616 RepID=A0A3M9YE08_9PEZI|nr:uncharacterized protein D7B24_004783 [Verticillium nonalfalfae]RNJ58331.1 hypothetical protein D7B24_004783 [Verticillium nonalfalfae]
MPVQDKLGPPGVSPLSRNPGQGLTEPDLRASVVGSLACAAAAHLPSVNPRVAETSPGDRRSLPGGGSGLSSAGLSFIRARDTFLDDEIGKHSNQSPHPHLVAQGRRAL